jgi:hypothetical protein
MSECIWIAYAFRSACLKAAILQDDRIVVHLATSTSVGDAAKFYDAELDWTIESTTNGAGMFVVSAKKRGPVCGVTITFSTSNTRASA